MRNDPLLGASRRQAKALLSAALLVAAFAFGCGEEEPPEKPASTSPTGTAKRPILLPSL